MTGILSPPSVGTQDEFLPGTLLRARAAPMGGPSTRRRSALYSAMCGQPRPE